MSLLSRVFTKQLFIRQASLKHQIAALSTIPSFQNSNKSNQNRSKHGSRFFNSTVISLTVGTCIVTYNIFKDDPPCLLPELPKVSAATTPSRRSQFNFIADVVETAAKSLVYIEIQDTRRMDYYTGKPATVSNGSGFIVESDGLILTNAHVVVNKPRSIVSVRLTDGRTFQGTVEAVDPVSDLATVRIQCKKLPVLKLGESSNIRAGEFVIALGSPLCKFSHFSQVSSFNFVSSSFEQHGDSWSCVFNSTTIRRVGTSGTRHQVHSNRCCNHVRQLRFG